VHEDTRRAKSKALLIQGLADLRLADPKALLIQGVAEARSRKWKAAFGKNHAST
jgi:hypothetical protein